MRITKETGKDINDFKVPLFMMQHFRSDLEFTHDETKCVQGIAWLKNRLTDIEDRWHRLPNFLRVDHTVKTTEVSGASNSIAGPKEFVTYLNQRWAEQPVITPTWTLSVPDDVPRFRPLSPSHMLFHGKVARTRPVSLYVVIVLTAAVVTQSVTQDGGIKLDGGDTNREELLAY